MTAWLDSDVRNLGQAFANLLSLEFAIRGFLYEQKDKPHNPLPWGLDVNELQEGDSVPENALTDYSTLGELIRRYNERIAAVNPELRIDPSLSQLRDCLAHGRISARSPNGPFRLVKLSRPKNNQVRVVCREVLTDEWLTTKAREAWIATTNVMKAAGWSDAPGSSTGSSVSPQ